MFEILAVDDERIIRESLAARILDKGYRVRMASSGAQAIDFFREARPDLVLLDVMMPGIDGYQTCAHLRELDRETPIVFLSALDSEIDQIRGLEVGADDYVSKTASDSLLFARIAKALERADRFSKSAAPVEMTRTEAGLYRLMDSDRGRYFSYAKLCKAVFGEGYRLDENAIRVHISNMRKKLPKGEIIEAKRGFGFALKKKTVMNNPR
jgi:DNA-binding response OmpR family regulator